MYGPEAALIAEIVHAAAALQRRLARLPARLDHRRRPVAVHRDVRCSRRFKSSFPIAIYIAVCAVIGIIATALLTDYTNKDISEEYDAARPDRAATD